MFAMSLLDNHTHLVRMKNSEPGDEQLPNIVDPRVSVVYCLTYRYISSHTIRILLKHASVGADR